MLLKGQGAPEHAEEAFRWCTAAAEQGLPEAQLQLADLYRLGLGVPQDVATAQVWYAKAAVQRNQQAAKRDRLHQAPPAQIAAQIERCATGDYRGGEARA
jgi:TPR repeat protein